MGDGGLGVTVVVKATGIRAQVDASTRPAGVVAGTNEEMTLHVPTNWVPEMPLEASVGVEHGASATESRPIDAHTVEVATTGPKVVWTPMAGSEPEAAM